MTELLMVATAAAETVDDIKIAFDENSQTLLRIIIGTILFGIALDTTVDDFKRAAKMPKAITVGILAQIIVLAFETPCGRS